MREEVLFRRGRMVFGKQPRQAPDLSGGSNHDDHGPVTAKPFQDRQGLGKGRSTEPQAHALGRLAWKGDDRIPGAVGGRNHIERQKRTLGKELQELIPDARLMGGVRIRQCGVRHVVFFPCRVQAFCPLSCVLRQGDGTIHDHERRSRKVIKQGGHGRVGVRQSPLGIRRHLDQRVVGFVIREQVFPGGKEHRGENRFGGFLCARIKLPGGLHGIAQKLDPVGFGGPGGKDIHDTASHAEFSGDVHYGNPPVAGPQQMAKQRFPLDDAAHFERQAGLREYGLGD